jgi:hypothetical protein
MGRRFMIVGVGERKRGGKLLFFLDFAADYVDEYRLATD